MSDVVIIDEKNFILNNTWGGRYQHLDVEWDLDFNEYTRQATLRCSKGNSELWNIGATIRFKLILEDGTEEWSEAKDMVFNVKNRCCESKEVTDEDRYDEDSCSMVEAHIKVNSTAGLHYKSHDFTKKDDINTTAFIVDGKTYYANKTILAAASPVFRAMFFSNFKESESDEIQIKDVDKESFYQFLELIYGYVFTGHRYSVDPVMQLADRYDVQCVRINCEAWMIKKGIEEDLEEMLWYSEKYALPLLQDECFRRITKEQVKEFILEDRFDGTTIIRLAEKMNQYDDECTC